MEIMRARFSNIKFERYWIIVLFTIAFLAYVAFIVYPLQGGLISSTELQSEALAGANPVYNPFLPIQELLYPQIRSIFIALVMDSHVLYANLHLGGSWLIVITATLALRSGKERYTLFAKSMTLFNVILFSFGATFAIAGILFMVSLFPTLAANLFHVYWWPLFIEAILFAAEIIFLYTFWFTWNRINPKLHLLLGYIYAVVVFFQTLMIDMLAGGMLTPGVTEITYTDSGFLTIPLATALAMWFNPSLWQLQWHRVFAAFTMFGFVYAMLGAFHYTDRQGKEDRAYWDWASSYGLNFGLFGLIAQPFLGLIYMLKISDEVPDAFEYIMHGPRAWEMLLMVGMVALLFLSVITFFIERRETVISQPETKNLHTIYKIFFVIALGATFILIQPAWLGSTFIEDAVFQNPLGVMDFKYVALGALTLIGTFTLTIDTVILSDPKESQWGNLNKASRGPLILSGIFGLAIVAIMGYVRESARSPWGVFEIIPLPDGMLNETPITLGRIYLVFLVAVLIAGTVFWLTSKATAHHPEQAERITLETPKDKEPFPELEEESIPASNKL